MNITPEQLYKRQVTLKEIGAQGQSRFLKARVAIIGCGGLGCVAASYLAGSGIGNILLIDYDTVETSNLHRQVFYKIDDVGNPKAQVLATYLTNIAPFSTIEYQHIAVVKENVFDLISKSDIVLDCTDSLPIKYLLNDACVIKNKILIYGSLYKFDGYISTFNLKDLNGIASANLRDAFPEISNEAIPNCSEVGTLNTIVGIMGLMQANEVLKVISKVGKPLANQLLIYNSLENSQYIMKLKKSFTKEMIVKIFEKETYYDMNCEVQDENLLITSEELKNSLSKAASAKDLKIISVIEDKNIQLPLKVDAKIPYSVIQVDSMVFDKAHKYVIICNKGITSYEVLKRIKMKVPELNVLSLKGGILNY